MDISKDKDVLMNYNQIASEIDRLRIAITSNDPASIPALINELNSQLVRLMNNVNKNYNLQREHKRERGLEIPFPFHGAKA